MRAAQINKYSKKINVAINEIPVPKPEDNEILVKVKVAILQITGSIKLIQDYTMLA